MTERRFIGMSTDMERAFYASDPAWDGRFVAAVRTTGIFCRPSCRVRKPLPKNVEFLPDAAAARAAGYRACLRCQPENGDDGHAANDPDTDRTDAGRRHRRRDRAVRLRRAADDRRPGRLRPPPDRSDARRRRRRCWIGSSRSSSEYFAGTRRDFDLPIDMPGSAFQERVWDELRRIPYGETISYRELAERVGAAAAYRAVGRANGSNRVAIVVPCHRVIAAGGGLGGYGGGLPAKRRLLDLERAYARRRRSSTWSTSSGRFSAS